MTITDEGKLYIKRYLAGQVGSIADSIAFGTGAAAESSTDSALTFEVGRTDVELVTYDFVNNKLIFKASLPDDFVGTLYEVALFSLDSDSLAGNYGSRLIFSFDSDDEDWTLPTNASYVTANARIGADLLRHTPALSTTVTSSATDLFLDFSGNSGADQFVLAYNVSNANVNTIKIRLFTDSSNYAEGTISSPAAGYNVTAVNKSAFTVTGSMDWGDITRVDILTTAKAAGATTVDYDGLRIQDTDTNNPDYILVAREVLATPYVKTDLSTEEIEFSLAVNV